MTYSFLKKTRGAVTLLFTVTLLMLSTLIILFATNFAIMQSKSTANMNRNIQAFEAAEAGLEYGINYLQVNSSTILANPIDGFIQPFSNASVTNVILANNSQYTITYSNPSAYNYNRIQVTSTGISDDGSATRVMSQQIQFGSMLANAPTVPLTSKGAVSLGGSAEITNTHSDTTLLSGQSVSISGSGRTVLASGTSSTAALIKSDVQQNVSSIESSSLTDFFATYFGVPSTTIKSNSANYYSNSTNTNYGGLLDGKTGTSIWIDQTGGTAKINGGTIGTVENPVLLVINGKADLTGNAVIYGFVYIMGETTTDVLGSVQVHGSIITQADISLKGSGSVTYDPTTLTNLRNQSSMRYYAKVPGTWKDF